MNAWGQSFLDRPIVQDWRAQLDFTTRIFRPRGLHLDDRHVRLASGESLSASIVDMALYVGNHAVLRGEGRSVVLYLPKIQTAEEAALWNDMLDAVERHLGLPRGEIKVYVLVEQIEACFQLMEIRAALSPHFVGFNTGRWDYINSVSDAASWDPAVVNPNIDAITMTYGYMRVYEDRVRRAVNTPDRQGRFALWQGGMEPNIPVGSPAGVQASMARAIAGAEREQREGASGKWVAHWKMVHIVRPVWEKAGEANQLGRAFPRLTYAASDADGLLQLDPAPRTIRGARDLISVALQYGNAFGRGFQAAALKPADFFGNDDVLYLMEDMATGEIRLSILWEWLHKGARLTAAGPRRGRQGRGSVHERPVPQADRRGVRQAAARQQPRRPRRLQDHHAADRARDRRDVSAAAGEGAVVRGSAEHHPGRPGPRDCARADRPLHEDLCRRRHADHGEPGLRVIDVPLRCVSAAEGRDGGNGFTTKERCERRRTEAVTLQVASSPRPFRRRLVRGLGLPARRPPCVFVRLRSFVVNPLAPSLPFAPRC